MSKIDWEIKTCPICGQTFIPTYKYVYKLRDRHQKIVYYCSYTCWRKDGGDEGGTTHGIKRRAKV